MELDNKKRRKGHPAFSHVSEATIPEEVRSEPGTPAWALKSLEEFLLQFKSSCQVLELCKQGISMITGMPQALTALAHAYEVTEESDKRGEITDKRVAYTKAQATLALREISSDFAILHSLSAVFLWNSLESLVKDILRDWVVNRPEVLVGDPWASQKVRVGEYEPLDLEQRAVYLVELVDQSLGGSLKQGVNRFEKLLGAVRLSGRVEEDVSKALFELQQVRNVLVHRAGIADRRLSESCPWLDLEPGVRIVIGQKQYCRYTDVVGRYTTELIFRTAEAFGVSDIRDRTGNRSDS